VQGSELHGCLGVCVSSSVRREARPAGDQMESAAKRESSRDRLRRAVR
jgi:hypothetical protein